LPYATRIAVLLSALSVGRLWARCMLGSDLIPRFHHCWMEPGIVGAAIYGAISRTSAQNAVTRTRRRMSSWFNSGKRSWSSTPSTSVCS